jgi:hypothetical protein
MRRIVISSWRQSTVDDNKGVISYQEPKLSYWETVGGDCNINNNLGVASICFFCSLLALDPATQATGRDVLLGMYSKLD